MDTRWGCAVKSGALHDMKPFNRERFLFWMLAGIFIFEGLLFTAGFIACWRGGGLGACPELGERYESTFSVMVATTLALLTGKAVAGVTRRSQSSFSDRDVSALQPPQQHPQQPLPPSQATSAQGKGQLDPSEQPARQASKKSAQQ